MWCSDTWQEYELIDAEGGERLERWGEYILVRPDPQVIWKGERRDPRWKQAHGVYRRVGGGGKWVVNRMPEDWRDKPRDKEADQDGETGVVLLPEIGGE